MGCMTPKNSSTDSTIYVSSQMNHGPIDFDNFFVVHQSPSETIKTLKTKSQSSNTKKGSSDTMTEVSSLDKESESSPSLVIDLYQINPSSSSIPASIITDKITMTPNLIKSNQGKVSKSQPYFIFGRKTEDCSHTIDYDIANDPHISPYQFEINYNEGSNKYYIDDRQQGSGLFKKIQHFQIHNSIIVNYCQNNMQLSTESNEPDKIHIRFLDGEFENEERSYIANETTNEGTVIRFGRANSNEIVSRNEGVSRIQWTLVYNKGLWSIYDGNYNDKHSKPSTNGLWLLIQDTIEITNDSIWKTGRVVLNASII